MIAKDEKEIIILQNSEDETIDMSLDENSTKILMQMLSKDLYSDEIGSVIRETASNALDSHRRAGVKEPIIVSLKPGENNNWEFTVEDFGTGLNDQEVKETISKYGKSTKRSSNNELGMFGLGFKSPLAYNNSFYFICRKDGIERKYMMYQGDDKNKIDLLYEIETEHRNGVKIIVPVRYGDVSSFQRSIKKQLAYFEDVWFDVKDYYRTSNNYIENNFKIIREEDWQYSEICTDNRVHICLDNVYYSLNPSDIGISDYFLVPIALRFNLEDGIYPTPNRESLKLNETSKKIISDKFIKVAEWFITRWEDSIQELDNFKEAYIYYKSDEKFITIEGNEFDISSFIKFFRGKIPSPSIKGIELLDIKHFAKNAELLFSEYTITHEVKNGSVTSVSRMLTYDNFLKKQVYVYEDKIPGIIKEFVRQRVYNNCVFVKKTKDIKLKKSRSNYFEGCLLKNYPKSQWRQVIKEVQFLALSLIDTFLKCDPDTLPKEWLEERSRRVKDKREEVSKRKQREKMNGNTPVRIGRASERRGGRDVIFETNNFDLSKMHRSPGIWIYDTYDNEDKLEEIFTVSNSKSIKGVFSISSRELKKIGSFNLHNFIKVDEFMKGNTKLFRRMVTADLIRDLVNENYNVFNKHRSSAIIKKISEDLFKDMEELLSYMKNNESNANSNAKYAILEIAKANNLFDKEIYDKYLKIKSLLEEISLEALLSDYKGDAYAEAITKVLVDVFKYKKIKVNLEHYSNSNTITAAVEEEKEEEEEEILEEELLEGEDFLEEEEEEEDFFPEEYEDGLLESDRFDL